MSGGIGRRCRCDHPESSFLAAGGAGGTGRVQIGSETRDIALRPLEPASSPPFHPAQEAAKPAPHPASAPTSTTSAATPHPPAPPPPAGALSCQAVADLLLAQALVLRSKDDVTIAVLELGPHLLQGRQG